MSANIDYINELLNRHYLEASDGLVEKSPSKLLRGEGTEKNFYIFKIDIWNSSMLLYRKQKATYLRYAHTFLSTIDQITKDFGADVKQTEYAGDSVIAYFSENTPSENILYAAAFARKAVLRMASLGGAVGELKPKCKVVLHFAPLIVSNIGPRADSFISAIGHPIHLVAKIEKDINVDTGRATKAFYEKLSHEYRKFLDEVATEIQVPTLAPSVLAPTYPPMSHTQKLASLLYPDGFMNTPQFNTSPPPQITTQKTIHGYNLRWNFLDRQLGLN